MLTGDFKSVLEMTSEPLAAARRKRENQEVVLFAGQSMAMFWGDRPSRTRDAKRPQVLGSAPKVMSLTDCEFFGDSGLGKSTLEGSTAIFAVATGELFSRRRTHSRRMAWQEAYTRKRSNDNEDPQARLRRRG